MTFEQEMTLFLERQKQKNTYNFLDSIQTPLGIGTVIFQKGERVLVQFEASKTQLPFETWVDCTDCQKI